MIGLVLPSALAAVAALLLRRGGTVGGRQRSIRFAWWGLIVAAFAVELVLYSPPVDTTSFALIYGPWLWVATRLVLLVALARNARARASGRWSLACLVMAIGIGLNTLVIVANDGHMPQSSEAAFAVWGGRVASMYADPTRLENTRPMDADSRLAWLGDILPEPTWLPRANVLSAGDILLAFGMAGWIWASLRPATDDGRDACSVADVELAEDVLDVRLHRLDREHQLVGDLSV